MIRKLFRSQSGASLVEFALLAPVMIFLLVGIIEIGRYTFFAILAANAARAGAQYGSYSLSTADDSAGIIAAATQDGQSISQFGATPTVYYSTNEGQTLTAWTSGAPPSGSIWYIGVVVTGTFTTLLHYPGIPTNVPITGSATMRLVNQ